MPARAPIGLESTQERLQRLISPVNKQSTQLEIPEWATPVQAEQEVEPEVALESPQEPVQAEEIPSWAIPTSEVTETPEWAIPVSSSDQIVL